MFVIEVIPLKRGIGIDSLTYFGAQEYPLGTILHIPVRNATILGLVTSVAPVSTAKTALRAATFSLRKLPAQDDVQQLSHAYLKTAEELANYYAAHVGNVLYSLLSPEIRNGDIRLPHTHDVHGGTEHTPEVLEGHRNERYLAYRSLVRETFAHGGSVLCVVPTSVEAHDVEASLMTGIEDRIIVLTSTMTKRELKEAYASLEDFSKPKLIIATPSHAVLERHDITLTLLEHARSPHYREHTRPYLDYRDVLRIHSKHASRRFIIGDMLVRTEEEHFRRMELYHTWGESPKRIELPGKLEIVHMNDKADGKTPFVLFSPKVLESIRETKKKKGRIFLFAARRGLAPVVACMDCGYIFRSPQSGAPYSLIRTQKNGVEERWFVCSTSGQRERAADTCPTCGSWRLRERGIGIQFVHDELRKLLPDVPLILFDHTTASTYKKACFLRDTFYGAKGAVMLGTHMAIPYLTREIDVSVIVNMDALLATPTWRLEEENLALILRLREATRGPVYIQTRSKDTDLVQHAKHGAIEHFYNEELELRKTFNYPPFTTFIHLTWQGTAEAAKKTEAIVASTLEGFPVTFYQNPTSTKEATVSYGLLRLASKDWPEKKLVAALKRIPPNVRTIINPDRIV